VNTTGDTMTGGLVVNFNTATNTVSLSNSGAGKTLYAANTNAAGYGVYGYNNSTGTGVYGANDTGTGIGVFGISGSGYGVYGESATGYAGFFNVTGNNDALVANSNGTGNLVVLTKTGGTQFYVNNTGNVFASGTITSVNANAFKAPGNGYFNFGNTLGLPGYGFRDNGGQLEFKDSGGSWTDFNTLGGGSYIAKAGDTMSGPLYIGFDTATASLHIKNAGNGNAVYVNNAGNTAATASLFVNTDNTNATGYAIMAQHSGNASAIYGYNTGTGSAGYFHINNVGNSAPPLYANTTGTGRLIELQKSGSPIIAVTNNGLLSASGTIIMPSGYMNFGTTAGASGYGFRDNGGSIQFKNNLGSWVNIPNGNGYVVKSGDEMTGALGIASSSATATVYVYQKGATNPAGVFTVDNAGNTSDALYITSNSNSNGLGMHVYHSGSSGAAAKFETTAGLNSKDTVDIFSNSNSGGNALYATHSGGSGAAGIFKTSNPANATGTVYIVTNSNSGGANALYVEHSGSGGRAADINLTGNSAYDVIYASRTNGAGALYGGLNQSVGSYLMRLKSVATGNNEAFAVDNEGNIYASGVMMLPLSGYLNFGGPNASRGGTGYGLRDNGGTIEFKNSSGSWTPFAAGAYVSKTGDSMTGPLVINYNTATSTLHVRNAAGNGNTAFFENTGSWVATSTVRVSSNNGDSQSLGLLVETSSGGAAVFSTALATNATNTVTIASTSNVPGSSALKIKKTGMNGNALSIRANKTNATALELLGPDGSVAAATATVYLTHQNTDLQSMLLNANNLGEGATAVFEQNSLFSATSAVVFSNRSNAPGNRTIKLKHTGTMGTAIEALALKTQNTPFRFIGHDSTINIATASVYMKGTNSSPQSSVLHVESAGYGSAAFFESTNITDNATPTVRIATYNNNFPGTDSLGLGIDVMGPKGRGLQVKSATTNAPLAAFLSTGANNFATDVVQIVDKRTHPMAAALRVTAARDGAAAFFETSNLSNATATVHASSYSDYSGAALLAEQLGSHGIALIAKSQTSNTPVALFDYRPIGAGYATSSVLIYAKNNNTGGSALHVQNSGMGGAAAVFENTSSTPATPTVLIRNKSDDIAAPALKVEQLGQDGSGALIEIGNTLSATPAVLVNSLGKGDLLVLEKNNFPKFYVDKNGNVFASGTVYSGMTGGSYVSKSGDAMNGPLYIGFDTATATLHLANHGGGNTLFIDATGNTAATASLYVKTNNTHSGSAGITSYMTGEGYAGQFEVDNTSSSQYAIKVVSNGLESAGYFLTNNTANNKPALLATATSNSPGGAAFKAVQVGTGAMAAHFQTTNNVNDNPVLYSRTQGGGHAGMFVTTLGANATSTVHITTNSTTVGGSGLTVEHTGTGSGAGIFQINNSGNTGNALGAYTVGTGSAGSFQVANTANTSTAVQISTNSDIGNAHALSATTTGTGGSAGKFTINNAGNSTYALDVSTNGTGNAGYFSSTNNANPNPVIYAITNSNSAGGHAIHAYTSGTGGRAGYFEIQNAGNNNPALSSFTTGGGRAGNFTISNATNSETALYAETNGTGNTAHFVLNNNGSSASAVYGTTNGTGYAGYFTSTLNTNANDALYAETNGTGNALKAYSTGSSGSAGLFYVSNNLGAANGITSMTNSSGEAVYAYTTGTGRAGYFEISNPSNGNNAISAMTNGTRVALYGYTDSSTGKAGYFATNNAANNTDTVTITTNSTTGGGIGLNVNHTGTGGAAIRATIDNVGSPGSVIKGNTTGTGNLIQLQKSATDRFVVDNNGVVAVQGCPGSFANAGNYCIEINERSSDSWWNAAAACQASGFTLCSASQWYAACNNGAITLAGKTDNFEWVDAMVSTTNAITLGGTSCAAVGSSVFAGPFTYRCCYSK